MRWEAQGKSVRRALGKALGKPLGEALGTLVGKALGRSRCEGGPVDQPLPMTEIIEKTTELLSFYLNLKHGGFAVCLRIYGINSMP